VYLTGLSPSRAPLICWTAGRCDRTHTPGSNSAATESPSPSAGRLRTSPPTPA